jgi:kynurenine formamidase
MSEQILKEMIQQVRNWGKWGPEDEIGTLNYITPEKVRQACHLVTQGKVFSLGIPFQRQGPQSGKRARFNPIHLMFRDGGDQPRDFVSGEGYGGSDDMIIMPLQCSTQWDSLAHIFYEGKMYNGYDATLVTSAGAAKNSIDKTKDKIITRGVLLDVARYKGVEWLASDYAITIEDLEQTATAQQVTVERGDILLVRTGHLARHLDQGSWEGYDDSPSPGLSFFTIPWLHTKEIAGVATDTYAVEVRPSEVPPFRSPLHIVTIPNMGLLLGEIFFLEDLAVDCATDGKWEFLLVAPPLPVTAAVGSPINPYAVK